MFGVLFKIKTNWINDKRKSMGSNQSAAVSYSKQNTMQNNLVWLSICILRSCNAEVTIYVFCAIANSADGSDAGGQSSAVTERQSAGRGPRGRGSHRGTCRVCHLKDLRTIIKKALFNSSTANFNNLHTWFYS